MSDRPAHHEDPSPPARPRPEQNADGIDLSLIRANLQRTPAERIRRGEAARLQALRLRQHARRIQ